MKNSFCDCFIFHTFDCLFMGASEMGQGWWDVHISYQLIEVFSVQFSSLVDVGDY